MVAIGKQDGLDTRSGPMGGFSYFVSDEQLADFSKLTDLQRLTWLDEARRFTILASTSETEIVRETFRAIPPGKPFDND